MFYTNKDFDFVDYDNQRGFYVKVGRKVWLQCNMRTDDMTKGSTADGADPVVIGGIPFAIDDSSSHWKNHHTAVGAGYGFAGDQAVSVQADGSTAFLNCLRVYKNLSNNVLDVDDLGTTANDNSISFEISYVTP